MARPLSISSLLKDERVFDVAKKAAEHAIVSISQYAVRAGKPVDFILDAYVRNMFPYYRAAKQPRPNAKAAPIPAVRQFWIEASRIGCYWLGDIELYVLSIADSTPTGVITNMSEFAAQEEARFKHLDMVFRKLKDDNYKYNSLKEIIYEGREKFNKFINSPVKL